MTGKQPFVIEVAWSPDFISSIVRTASAQGAAQASRMVIPIVAEDLMTRGPLRKIVQASI
jgi:hypothetical protein